MQAVEIEVKFRVGNPEALGGELLALGFHEQTPRSFEHNTLFDTPQHSLREARSILRIRRYGSQCTLTHKALPRDYDPAERHKHREETETAVQDGEALAHIFEQLGLRPSFIYEKWRTEYSDGEGHCVLDETPIGVYAELEGTESWIDRQTEALRLTPEQLTTLSYGRLFEQWVSETGSAAQRLTFAECAYLPARN